MSATVDDVQVTLAGPDGSSAKITLFGAHVTSFITSEGQECFFMSTKSSLTGPEPIRGGIPICWPAFAQPDPNGPFSKLALHGFARQQVWKYNKTDSPAKAIFTTESNDKLKETFPHDFNLKYTVEIKSGTSIKVTMEVSSPSTSDSNLPFQFALHNYLRLPSNVYPHDVSVDKILSGLEYKNLMEGGVMEKESRDTFIFEKKGTGRLYSPVPNEIIAKLGDSGKSFKIESTGEKMQDLVTFQPGEERGNQVPDLHAGGWKEFVCFEPARIHDIADLKAGQTWTASQTITCM